MCEVLQIRKEGDEVNRQENGLIDQAVNFILICTINWIILHLFLFYKVVMFEYERVFKKKEDSRSSIWEEWG